MRRRRKWRLALEALALLWLVRLVLWALPFQRVQQLTGALARPLIQGGDAAALAWAIEAASRWAAAPSCLVRALAAQLMLSWRGLTHTLYIGVARGASGRLEAHAWLEHEGRVLVGGLPDLARFTPLDRLP